MSIFTNIKAFFAMLAGLAVAFGLWKYKSKDNDLNDAKDLNIQKDKEISSAKAQLDTQKKTHEQIVKNKEMEIEISKEEVKEEVKASNAKEVISKVISKAKEGVPYDLDA